MADKAIFLDRDDTLIRDHGYINDPDQVELLAGVGMGLRELRKLGFKLVIISNQSGIARGILTEKTLKKINDRLEKLLLDEGAYIDGIYYCPYFPDGSVEKYRKDSDLRKPMPGMLLKAADEMDIELGESWMIGDSERDIDAGFRAGCRTVLVNRPETPMVPRHTNPEPNYYVTNFFEAVNIIKRHVRESERPVSESKIIVDKAPVEENVSEPVIEKDIAAEAKPVEQINHVSNITKPVLEKEIMEAGQTEKLLKDILKHLKESKRSELYREASSFGLAAGVFQMAVFFCLLMSIWKVIDFENNVQAVGVLLGFGILFQLLAMMMFIIHSRK